MIANYLDKAEKRETEAYFAGFIGDEELEILEQLWNRSSYSKAMQFPGFMVGWKTEKEAEDYLNMQRWKRCTVTQVFKRRSDRSVKLDQAKWHRVIFRAPNAQLVCFAGDVRLVGFRLQGRITNFRRENRILKYEFTVLPSTNFKMSDWKRRGCPESVWNSLNAEYASSGFKGQGEDPNQIDIKFNLDQ